ncbi:helix-turn-helix transcriptional regulator [Devosia naphthalenivorans]|uniref:helix-turn-helix transcriptional regulator n=1 Tax=Devosia naphthalenivorans TaxID=2082392 RepID=UPI000D33D2CE|nr:helix-turn-helix domain-containing protein [Devosia naphthalenivorans]
MTTGAPAHVLLNTKQAAEYLNLSTSALEKARVSGINCPPYVAMGRAVRYRVEDLQAFVAARIRTNTGHNRSIAA